MIKRLSLTILGVLIFCLMACAFAQNAPNNPAAAVPVWSATSTATPITGTLSSGTATVATPNLGLPAVIVFNSSNGGRAVSVSFDSGTTFYALTDTYTTTGQQIFVLTTRCTNIKFTGAIADTYSIY